ncbi:facilitated trehalose transporter Tret1-like [Helicoverpa zea]|uniref:facilitated trehalose transporter Tret1-like n=1 Tax=Helicoverpa zea TaxID=7113 RepID=UPI001F59D7A2|nr:facilitated trehalose transporter Tret1-like [Helicoverpa zea]
MDKCQYTEVPNITEKVVEIKKKTNWKPFFKQLIIASGVWTSVFLYGLCVGAPTMFIPQIRREANDTSVITDDMASWLSSAYSFSGFPFVIILSIITKFVGRKIPFIIAALDTLAAFIVLFCSTTITQLLISEIMQGLFSALNTTVTVMILTEYTSPKYRGIFLTIKTATFYWGIWTSNAIGTFFHWKKIPLFGIVCSLYALINVMMWPESPVWLASRGKFEECAAAHRSLKGCDEDSEKELEALIASEREYLASCDTNLSAKGHIIQFFKTIKSKEFYKPALISNFTGFLGFCSGKLIFAVYAIDVLKKITKSESTAYVAMLVIDGFTVFSMYLGCILAKHFNRRSLLLVASAIGAGFLFVLALYLFLITKNVINENKYVTISLFVAFSIAVSCGPLTMCMSVFGELIPLRSRNLSICFIALSGKLSIGIALKIAPWVFKNFGVEGAAFSFGVISSITIMFLYKYLPETKDKTLQQIADNINGSKSKKATASLLDVSTK